MDEQPTPTTPEQPQATNQPKPVAYDSEGRPLYAEPPLAPPAQASYGPQPGPQFVHLSRAVEPMNQPVSEEVKTRHDDSTRRFPNLDISEAEYVISAVQRHPIGLAGPVFLTFLLLLVISLGLMNYGVIMETMGVFTPPPFGGVLLAGLLLMALVLIGCYISIWIYLNNRFFLTNESVVQEIQTSLFSRNEQTVSLANIEDASFTQKGILQTMLNYGSIRLSTEGDETTYRFNYVANPKEQISLLNNAVEAFKNGRPVVND